MSERFLSVVLPCRNQEDHIEGVLRRYLSVLGALPSRHELVVVPNACTDDTPAIVRALATGEPRLRVVESALPGWGRAVLTGLAATRGSVLCYTNSARTDPETILALLALYEERAPCLAKVRRRERGFVLREMGSFLYNLEGRLLFGIEAGDVNGTPKILARQLYETLDLGSQDDLLDMELLAKVTRLGIPVVELPAAGFKRHGGRSSTSLKSAFKMYAGAFRLRRTLAPSRVGN